MPRIGSVQWHSTPAVNIPFQEYSFRSHDFTHRVDVLEPGLVPTEHRVAGGLSLQQLKSIFEVLAEREVVEVEIAEFESSDLDSPLGVAEALLDASRRDPGRLFEHRRGDPCRQRRSRGRCDAALGMPFGGLVYELKQYFLRG